MGLTPTVEGLRTQISGKYSPDNPGLFTLRHRLASLGIQVRFPAGNEIIEYSHDFAITTAEEGQTPFPRTEEQFLQSVEESDLHVVYDIWGDEDGYVGQSTIIETLRALYCDVPTVWMRPPGRLSPAISPDLRIFAERAKSIAWVERLDRLPDHELLESVGRLAARTSSALSWEGGVLANDYEQDVYRSLCFDLLGQYSRSWEAHIKSGAQ
ncbi:MAG TPA: hypothetical protein VLH86_02060 [Patescibacteria group bacterium]|nr:hypothetical protein [Patescibacteria group bacterium]